MNLKVQSSFRLAKRQAYPWWFAIVVVIAGFIAYVLLDQKQTSELLLSLFGSIVAFFHFLYSQHNTNTERFVSLFKEFNARFDSLNEDLNRIRNLPENQLPDPKDIQILFDYFNLCAEEYLYFKAGYIDHEVWLYWANGMSYFNANEAIHKIWSRELEQGSYYGFKLSLLTRIKS